MPRLLVINPNISDNVTALIEAEARRSAAPGTELTMLTAPLSVVKCGNCMLKLSSYRSGKTDAGREAALVKHGLHGHHRAAG